MSTGFVDSMKNLGDKACAMFERKEEDAETFAKETAINVKNGAEHIMGDIGDSMKNYGDKAYAYFEGKEEDTETFAAEKSAATKKSVEETATKAKETAIDAKNGAEHIMGDIGTCVKDEATAQAHLAKSIAHGAQQKIQRAEKSLESAIDNC